MHSTGSAMKAPWCSHWGPGRPCPAGPSLLCCRSGAVGSSGLLPGWGPPQGARTLRGTALIFFPDGAAQPRALWWFWAAGGVVLEGTQTEGPSRGAVCPHPHGVCLLLLQPPPRSISTAGTGLTRAGVGGSTHGGLEALL